MSARLLAAGLLLALGGQATAQSGYPTLGRLFTTPAERLQLDRQRFMGPRPGSAPPPQPVPAPAPEPAANSPLPPAAPVTLTGIVRRSNGEATVLVGDELREQRLPPVGPGTAISVDVNGRQVLLKPGQSVDPADGSVQDGR